MFFWLEGMVSSYYGHSLVSIYWFVIRRTNSLIVQNLSPQRRDKFNHQDADSSIIIIQSTSVVSPSLEIRVLRVHDHCLIG